jgi:hypothetical protein
MINTHAILLTATIGGTPTDIAPPNSVDVEHSDDSIHVLAYDADGDVTAEIVEWWDGADIRIDANFPDGVYLSATVRGEDDITIESNDPAVVSERIAAVEDILASTPTGASKWLCAAEVLAAGFTCATVGGPAGAGACALGALLVSCACIPLIAKDVPDDAECFE